VNVSTKSIATLARQTWQVQILRLSLKIPQFPSAPPLLTKYKPLIVNQVTNHQVE
jgi:hypothetical protein